MSTPHIVYVSFDRFPAPKGAATHIAAFVRTLGNAFGDVELVTVAPDANAPFCIHGVTHHPLPAPGDNLISRVLAFRDNLGAWWNGRRADVVHVRSIFEGYPIARNKQSCCEALIFEVNGLPSIELKYHYPKVAEDHELLDKLRHQEDVLITAADTLVTPSRVTAAHLIERGAHPERVVIIPNGVDTQTFFYQPPRQRDGVLRALYAGTMTAWQGVYTAIEALALFRRDFEGRLLLVGPTRSRQRRKLLDYAQRLDLLEHVELCSPVDRDELCRLHHQSDVVLAPLLPNDRNLVQGCCPLKIIEAMAAGTPIIASDMPVVSDLAERDVEALLVRPGSAKAVKDSMLRLQQDRDLATCLSSAARRRVERDFTWDGAGETLVSVYEGLLSRPSTRSSAARSRAG